MTTYSSGYYTKSIITGSDLVEILDLGMHAYADTFVSENQLHLSEPVFPLKCYLAPDSGHIQLGYISSDRDRYSLYSYSYTSSNSRFSRNHWTSLSERIKEEHNLKDKVVVEIGSNDGFLLERFMDVSSKLVGIDPSAEMCHLAMQRGLTSLNQLFDSEAVDYIDEKYGPADLIISNNVLNHANNPVAFVKNISQLLANDGVWIFEVPYWKDMVVSGKFDQIYHEHISYFTAKSVSYLLALVGLSIEKIEVVDYHGGSLRVQARKGTRHCEKVVSLIQEETEIGLFDIKTYHRWFKNIIFQRDKFMSDLLKIRLDNPGIPVIGVGAAAKANTLLNVYRMDSTVLDCVTDSSSFKQGKYTPLTRIPIRGDAEFAKHEKCFALILSWNISDILKDAILKINPNTEFINL